ncbi:MAG TPA: wax ester/triacylglycerol synthase family O-acyltransferase [Actinomycetales bacterium]|nr:wax ester/triacylglycerol synthase family O-acyltransferase [Actinomycetales bacterium]
MTVRAPCREKAAVSDRLTPLDVSFLYLEETTTVMHVGSVMVFDAPEGGFDYDQLVRHISARIAFVPRYRQRVRQVPGRLANPVWVDAERFDITYHVRRSALPRPGSLEQLRELVARVQPRPLDRSRPLWEVYLVEGLDGPDAGGFAIITKTHQALVDGVNAVDLAQVVLDDSPNPATAPSDTWRPRSEPSLVELVTAAVMDTVRTPTQVVDTLRSGLGDLRATADKVTDTVGGLLFAARTATRPAPESPLNVPIGGHRRFGMVATDLADYRAIRAYHAKGGRRGLTKKATKPTAKADHRITINDVVLATIAGALREWLLTRGSSVRPTTLVRALVPVSVTVEDEAEAGTLGTSVVAQLVDLPVGEPSPVLRLQQVAYQMRAHAETGRAVGADRIAGIGGFAPPTLHSLGARVASGLSRRVFNLVITNVPGPQQPLYVAGARMLSSYPVVPLAKGQALAIGLTSYDGGVYYGLNADRDAMKDLDVLGGCIADSLAELAESVR